MSYRPRPDFDQPTAESVQRSRRTTVWFMPLFLFQQGTMIFGRHADWASRQLGVIAWIAVSIAILWLLLGLPLRWLSDRDQAVLNDEWQRSVSGEASKWGIAAMVLIGGAMLLARAWLNFDAGLAIYLLVNGALVVAVARYAWLNRGEPDGDE